MSRADRLASVLRVRRLQEDAARGRLALAAAATRTARAAVIDEVETYGSPSGASGEHDDWLQHRTSTAAQAGAIVAARRQAAALQSAEEETLTTWRSAARHAAVAERLHLRAATVEARAAAAAAQAAADDLTIARMARLR